MKINIQHCRTNKGFSLIEMIVYIALLTIFTTVLVSTVVSLLKTKNQLEAREEIAYSDTVAIERITREIRKAQSVDISASTFGSHPGVLVLHTRDLSNNPTTITVTLVSNTIFLQEGLGTAYPLSANSIDISNLVFTRYTSANTEGILIEITAEKNIQGIITEKNYRTFVRLAGS